METKKESKIVELMGELRREAKRTGVPVLAIGQPDDGHLAIAAECTSGDAFKLLYCLLERYGDTGLPEAFAKAVFAFSLSDSGRVRRVVSLWKQVADAMGVTLKARIVDSDGGCVAGDAPAGGEDADPGGLLKDVSKN